MCHEHASDIMLAQGQLGIDKLADWLKPDAKLDPLDAFDADYDNLHGYEIERHNARMMHVANVVEMEQS